MKIEINCDKGDLKYFTVVSWKGKMIIQKIKKKKVRKSRKQISRGKKEEWKIGGTQYTCMYVSNGSNFRCQLWQELVN